MTKNESCISKYKPNLDQIVCAGPEKSALRSAALPRVEMQERASLRSASAGALLPNAVFVARV